jgi:hypothetical protein
MAIAEYLIPGKTPNPTRGSQGSWRASSARRKKQRRDANYLTPRRMQVPAIVLMTRLSSGELDDDNLRPALKSIRDGIADALGIDDRDPSVRWEYAQARCKRGDEGVRVRITNGKDLPGVAP